MKKLKTPELKMPAVLVDLYWDLRDRRLLPVIGLVVLAIAAVPFILASDSKQGPSPALQALTAGASPVTSEAGSHTLDVVEARPGLRNYHQRLSRRSPTNPFRQKFTAPVLSGAELNPETETSTGATTTTTTTTTPGSHGSQTVEGPHEYYPHEAGAPSGENQNPENQNPSSPSQPTLLTYVIKVRISRSGGKGKASQVKEKPIVRDRVLPQTALPGDQTPVATYLGVSRSSESTKHLKALFLVSGDVKSVFGETKCVSGEETCQLIEVEPGWPVTFVYGPNDVHYTISVLKVELVPTRHG